MVRREIDESTAAFLREARAALLAFCTVKEGEQPVNADAWKAEATRRWGAQAKCR